MGDSEFIPDPKPTGAQPAPDFIPDPPAGAPDFIPDPPAGAPDFIPDAAPTPAPLPPSLSNRTNQYRAVPDEVDAARDAAFRENHPIVHALVHGLGEGAGDIAGVANPVNVAKGAWDTFPPVAAYKALQQSIPAIRAYHSAREAGKSVTESLTVANEVAMQHNAANQMLKERADEFEKDPGKATVRSLLDAGALVMSFLSGNPEAEEGMEGAAEPALNPNEAAVQKSVAKADLAPGRAGTPATTTRTPARTITTAEAEAAPTGTMHEPILQNSARNQVNATLNEAGLHPVSDATDLRDVGDQASRQFYQRSAEGFRKVEELTGKNLNALQQQLKNLYRRRAETFADPEAEGRIIEKINQMEAEADQAFAQAKLKDPNFDVTKPMADWKQSKALANWGETVRGSVDPLAKSGTFDPSKYTPKLERLYRSDARYPGTYDEQAGALREPPTQLEQAFGKDRAETMRDDAYAASDTQKALKEFKPKPAEITTVPASTTRTPAVPPTEAKALYELVRQNTGRRFGVGGEVTNWGKVYKSFDKLSPAERAARFSDPAAVEKVVLSQARKQFARRAGAAIGAAAVAHVFGVDRYIAARISAGLAAGGTP